MSVYRRHHEVVQAIERTCRVAEWRAGDIDLWPLASQDLFQEMFRNGGRETAQPRASFAIRAATTVAVPAANLWKGRHSLPDLVSRPHRADAILLGDGVSLDMVDGSWRDRFGEPVVAALERHGLSTFVMQPGNLTRLPWLRPTYPANQIAARAAIIAALAQGPKPQLPDHADVMGLVEDAAEPASSLSAERLKRRAGVVAAQAAAFERILRRVRPKVVFVVTYYAGLGHAMSLACRRRGVLCVDLQHCPYGGIHRAYRWSTLPPSGYSTLPGMFWTWTSRDAANIERWAPGNPWHRAIAGGHTQTAELAAGHGESMSQRVLNTISDDRSFDREILVALQPIGGKRAKWEALANDIESSPSSWRWWIRRHPASTPAQDKDYAPLLSLDRPGVIAGDAAQIPLPALLGRMDAVVSLASGAAAEAAMFNVPAFFLDEEALDTFPDLIAGGDAIFIGSNSLISEIAARAAPSCRRVVTQPSIEQTLDEIHRSAEDYSILCREARRKQFNGVGGLVGEFEPPGAV
jgi:hypothetical protein